MQAILGCGSDPRPVDDFYLAKQFTRPFQAILLGPALQNRSLRLKSHRVVAGDGSTQCWPKEMRDASACELNAVGRKLPGPLPKRMTWSTKTCKVFHVSSPRVVEKRQGHLTSSASLPPTRWARARVKRVAGVRPRPSLPPGSPMRTATGRPSPPGRTGTGPPWPPGGSPLCVLSRLRSFSPAPSRPSPRQRAALPKLRPQAPTLRQWNQFSVTGSACSRLARGSCIYIALASPCTIPIKSGGYDPSLVVMRRFCNENEC